MSCSSSSLKGLWLHTHTHTHTQTKETDVFMHSFSGRRSLSKFARNSLSICEVHMRVDTNEVLRIHVCNANISKDICNEGYSIRWSLFCCILLVKIVVLRNAIRYVYEVYLWFLYSLLREETNAWAIFLSGIFVQWPMFVRQSGWL